MVVYYTYLSAIASWKYSHLYIHSKKKCTFEAVQDLGDLGSAATAF